MKIYLRTWTAVAAACAGLGLVLAVAMLPTGLVVIASLFTIGGVLALTDVPSLQAAHRARTGLALTVPRRLQLGVLAAIAVMATCGWAALMGMLAATLVLVLAAGAAPWLVDHAWRTRPPIVVASPVAPVQTLDAARAISVERAVREHVGRVVAAWTDDDLCRAWRSSFVRLQRCAPTERAVVAVERQIYLDEIERRYPAGFGRWMSTNPRAASDPQRYLRAA